MHATLAVLVTSFIRSRYLSRRLATALIGGERLWKWPETTAGGEREGGKGDGPPGAKTNVDVRVSHLLSHSHLPVHTNWSFLEDIAY